MEGFHNYPFNPKLLLNLYFPDYCQMHLIVNQKHGNSTLYYDTIVPHEE